jgi:hypothetical protein
VAVSTELPREVRYLRFLQTLDLQDSSIEMLPEEVGLLTQLVCLRCNGYTRVPAGLIGKLASLQELCIWCENDEDATMQFVKELGQLRELRVLQAFNHRVSFSESIGSALLESLGHLHNIKELKIRCFSEYQGRCYNAGWVSCRHLCFLRLDCFEFSGLPVWINSSLSPNVSYLYVKVVAVTDQDMETLAKLPELNRLILYSKSDTQSVVSIKIRTDEGVVYFRKLRFLNILGPCIWFDLRGSECNSSRVALSNTLMPSLESLRFDVHVRSLKDKKLQLGFDKMLGFQDLGRSSLQRVVVQVNCEGASIWDVKEAEAALQHAAGVHPKHPTLRSGRINERYTMSRYQEV